MTEAPTLEVPLVKSPARCPMCGDGGHNLAPLMNARCECGGVMVHIESPTADCEVKSESELLAAANRRVEILEGQLLQVEEFARANAGMSEEDRGVIQEAMELCRSCRGVPEMSINRCAMCRKLQAFL